MWPDKQDSSRPDQAELSGYARTVGDIQWLLAILAVLYQVVRGDSPGTGDAGFAAAFVYTGFVLLLRYQPAFPRDARWVMVLQTLAMIAFVTWICWHGGRLASPLTTLYMLAVKIGRAHV